ncbi:MAG: Gfo/Idh/MocA family oxidoreductase [Actinobacteria bacterium]|nr:MAG: Gfo/Idh/MocA family oxidoreductase [Actinomycetota bacterium]
MSSSSRTSATQSEAMRSRCSVARMPSDRRARSRPSSTPPRPAKPSASSSRSRRTSKERQSRADEDARLLRRARRVAVTERIRWGLLSTARINTAILNGAHESDSAEVIAVASRDRERALAYAAEHGIERAYGSYPALLGDQDVDAVYISLPNSMHVEWTIWALDAGKPHSSSSSRPGGSAGCGTYAPRSASRSTTSRTSACSRSLPAARSWTSAATASTRRGCSPASRGS